MNWLNHLVLSIFIAGIYSLPVDDVINLPVHVHVFKKTNEQIDYLLNETNVRNWIEGTGTRIRIGKQLNSLLLEDVKVNQIYTSLGVVWNQAKIQFKLETYDIMTHDSLENQVLSANPLEFLPLSLHTNYKMENGIHIYVGRNTNRFGFNNTIISGLTRGPSCTNNTNRDHAIALAWDTPNENGITLAHEIGHFLGLQHPDESYFYQTCGIELLSISDKVSGNLMISPSAKKAKLTEKQIARARDMACRYLSEWKIKSAACASMHLQ